MPRRRDRKPDTRLRWSDPAMPVLREYRFGNGEVRREIDPDYERRYREMLMETSPQPSYRNDPTYNLRKDRTK